MMETHLHEVVFAMGAKEVDEKAAHMITHGVEKIFLKLWSVLLVRESSEGQQEVSFTSKRFWHIKLVLKNVISPSSSEDKVDGFEHLLRCFFTSSLNFSLWLLNFAIWHEHLVENTLRTNLEC